MAMIFYFLARFNLLLVLWQDALTTKAPDFLYEE